MLLFLDCEFTDFLDIDLVSIGLVSDTGRYEFYAERMGFRHEACSEFVRAAVLPLLGQAPGAACDREELRKQLWAFFASLPGEVRLAMDSRHDPAGFPGAGMFDCSTHNFERKNHGSRRTLSANGCLRGEKTSV